MATQQYGIIITDFGSSYDIACSSVQQTDGKLVLAGYSYNSNNTNDGDFALARYNLDGSLDKTFGNGGKVTTDFGSSRNAAYSLVQQTDGKLVLAGDIYNNNTSDSDFALARYNLDGSLDNTFGNGGKVTTAFSSNYDAAYSSVQQTDGKLVLAGYSFNNGSSKNDFALARYNLDGSLDKTFGNGGKVTTDFNSSYDYANSLVQQPNGKLVLAGYSYNSNNTNDGDFALARYNLDGSLDKTFGNGGKVTTDFNSSYDYANSLVQQTDGKLVLAGYSYNSNNTNYDNFTLARYNLDGSLDKTFGNGGKVITDFSSNPSYGDHARSLVQQTDGKLVLAGNIYDNTSHSDFALARYNLDGSLDKTFGNGGKVTTDFSFNTDEAYSLVQQIDGKLVLAGNSNNDFALARYNLDGSLDETFNGGNYLPTGAVLISDTTPELNQVLTVSNTLADKDGLGTISYVWLASSALVGVGENYTVTANDLGKKISVVVNYVDDVGNSESVTSAETSVVTFAKLTINGTAEDDVLTGDKGDDKLYGYAGDDALKGGDGNDSLSGGTGKDKLEGNTGDDVLNGGSGNDTLFGNTGNDIERGEAGNDRLWGIRGHDTLDGGMGDDRLFSGKDSNLLTGGEGMDSFRFFATSGSTITDFVIADDSIELKKTFFAVGSKGVLDSDSFVNGTVALDADDFILYDSGNGVLSYDKDGNGTGAAVQIALLGITEHPALTVADFAVV